MSDIELIDRLLSLNIGDSAVLIILKTKIEKKMELSNSEKKYLDEMFDELKEINAASRVQKESQTQSNESKEKTGIKKMFKFLRK